MLNLSFITLSVYLKNRPFVKVEKIVEYNYLLINHLNIFVYFILVFHSRRSARGYFLVIKKVTKELSGVSDWL